MLLPLPAALLLACTDPDAGRGPVDVGPFDSGSASTDGTDPADSGGGATDSGAPLTWTTLPADCTPPALRSADPFTMVGSVINTQTSGGWFTEILDVVYLPDEDRVLTAGQGGLVVHDVEDPAEPVTRGHLGAADDPGLLRYYNLLAASPGRVWVTHREFGLDTLSLDDPDRLSELHSVDGLGYEGMARSGDHLYIASTRGYVDVFDVSAPDAPAFLWRLDDLGRPWDIEVAGDAAYVADADLGVLVLSLADPAAPVEVGRLPSAGQPFRLRATDDALYVASGAAGLEIFDRTDPLDPVATGSLDAGGGVQDVAVLDGFLGVVTQEAVVLYDISRAGTPTAPSPYAYEETEQYAMALHAADGLWAVGDWNILGMWALGDDPAPAVDLAVDQVAFLDGAETRRVTVTNRGGADLALTGLVPPDGVEARVSATTLAPGQSGLVELDWQGGDALDGTLCLATDDPGRPTVSLHLTSGGEGQGKAVGQQAPDFVLQDLDGVEHRLSEQLGHPVVLAYFATW